MPCLTLTRKSCLVGRQFHWGPTVLCSRLLQPGGIKQGRVKPSHQQHNHQHHFDCRSLSELSP